MFSEGLDSKALRWAREGGGAHKRDVPVSFTTRKPQSDPTGGRRGGRRGSGLGNGNVNRYGSDMDTSSDSEDGIYGGQYSLESSPQDDKVPRRAGARNAAPMSKNVNSGQGQIHSDSSLFEKSNWGREGNGVERMGGGGGRHTVKQPGFIEDESSDSANSSDLSFSQSRSSKLNKGTCTSGSFSSSVASWANVESIAKQDFFHGRGLQNKKPYYNDSPSAPPYEGFGPENEQAERSTVSRAKGTPFFANSNGCATRNKPIAKSTVSGTNSDDSICNGTPDPSLRISVGVDVNASLGARLPTFHASGLGPWCAVIAYDACVRLCLHSWAKGCTEAPSFLNNECAVLRNAFGLDRVLLQPEEELLARKSHELVSEGAAPKPKKTFGRMKVQVRKVKIGLDPPTGCSSITTLKTPKIKMETLRLHSSNLKSTLYTGWEAVRRIRVATDIPANGSLSRRSLAYVQASTQYIKQVSGILKTGVTTLRSNASSFETVQDTYNCLLRLKSCPEGDAVRMQAGSGETHLFLPDSLGDDLIIEVQDSRGQYHGRVLAQVAAIAENPGEKLRWWSIYREPEHELVGRIQLFINYSTSVDENNLKCGTVAETVAYDFLLEVAMKVQHFQQRNLLLHGQWKWLVTEFASYYGISDAYTKLRYLTYVMDVATPTKDCLSLVHELLLPVVMKGNRKNVLSHQENRILGEIEDQVQQILALTFENYKSLDESLPSGMVDVFGPAIGFAAPALEPAVQLYTLLHDVLTSETQLKFCRYFQVAAKRRSKRHLAETDEFISSSNEGTLMDPHNISTSYQKMKALILSIRNEILTDIEIESQHILPSFIELPNLSSSIYNVELCNRLRAFLVACPPAGPSPHVTELVIATADFQRDLAAWNINYVKGGVAAKELFHSYIMRWIQDKRLALLESCRSDKVKWSGVRTEHSTTPFVDDMYGQLNETLKEYEIIIGRWPEYTLALENAIADVEKAVIEALDKQYSDVLSPLKENLNPMQFGIKYVQKLTKGTVNTYLVPDELGILLNSMRRMLDILRPKISTQLKSWASCIPDGGNAVPGERLSEITVMLRAKLRNYMQAVAEKLAENTRLQNATKLRKIIQDSKETVIESDVRNRMQPLKDLLIKAINDLYTIFESRVFIPICQGFWDRMGQDVLHFLENKRENGSVYKGLRIAVSIVDDTFASEMQQLLGHALQEKDLEPPRSIMELRSMLCKDAVNHSDNYYY